MFASRGLYHRCSYDSVTSTIATNYARTFGFTMSPMTSSNGRLWSSCSVCGLVVAFVRVSCCTASLQSVQVSDNILVETRVYTHGKSISSVLR
ncbi:Uncharacterized protein TCM_028272 [Theobroma cacao]|uniref:Uncharacterized protein n=1 Tax=Theobroma cacao TaxID=3641 RepID=A0A061GHG4_THECC|nr:Uncharacterized protein TCM_028272 [Theobroma cacao]